MKCYVIRETTGYPTIMRNGQRVDLSLGDQFTEDELSSLQCSVAVTYMCTEDNAITTQEPSAPVVEAPKAAPAVKTAPAPKTEDTE